MLDKDRYSRHILLNNIGIEGQKKLKKAKVLIVGAGGLGSPIIQYLSAAGIGRLGIMDKDIVDVSNLQRQVIYKESQIGEKKAVCAKLFAQELNSEIDISVYDFDLNDENALDIISNYDIVVGATDNYKSRYIIDKTCKITNSVFVNGSIGEFEGQVGVFNFKNSVCYSDIFGEYESEIEHPKGVLGVLPGIIGSIQATEVLKIILEIGDVLASKLLIFDALSMNTRIIEL
ncbi:MAG: HesA/MoeB/ThiF family protein [Marinifilaceae bacterium]|jgi:adenylyltransferase/sulfurtransferase|nr:HesA/MoeB/ThiF family protein [Marinifilaceae bacterium]